MQICGWYLEQLVGLTNIANSKHFFDDANSGAITESMSVGRRPVLDSGTT